MQIGPSLSVLQALGSHPGAPEPARLQPAAQAEATAEVQRVAEGPEPASLRVGAGHGPEAEASSTGAAEPGRRLDIRV